MEQSKSLLERLRDAEEDFLDKDEEVVYSWIPISSINEIFAKRDVVLKELRLTIEVSDDMESFIFNEAKRLVALLIRRNHLSWLGTFHREKFGDDCFPVKFKHTKHGDKTQQWTIQSCKPKKSFSLQPDASGGTGSFKDALKTFCEHEQWGVFVPVFQPDDDAHVFQDRCDMPYLREVSDPNKTNYSVVRHFVMHQAHLNFKPDDQIVRSLIPRLDLS